MAFYTPDLSKWEEANVFKLFYLQKNYEFGPFFFLCTVLIDSSTSIFIPFSVLPRLNRLV